MHGSLLKKCRTCEAIKMTWFGYKKQKPDIPSLIQKKDINGLLQALTWDDFEIQTSAAKGIRDLGPKAVDTALDKIKIRDRAIRLGIIEALSEIRDPRSVPHLLDLMKDTDPEVRWGTSIALGEIGDERAVPELMRALEDPDKYVRFGSSFALAKIGWKPETSHEKALLFYGMQEWGAIREMGAAALHVLENARKDRDVGIRLKAVDLLGDIRGADVTPALIKSLADESSEVRWKTVLTSEKAGVPHIYLPRGISRRPRIRKNPKIAALLNFLLPGQGYNYLGKWWGILIFQFDVTITLWLLRFGGEQLSYAILFPLYLIIAIHAAYIAIKMPDL